MKNFIKNAFLVIIVVLLASTFLERSQTSAQTSLENNVIIVEKGEAIDGEDNDDSYYEVDDSSNVFSKIGSAISNLFFKIAELVSKVIGSVFIVMPYSYLEIL